MPAKQWKSFSDQLILLKSRGLIIEDEPAALDYLERIGYYRLSGYWYPFRKMKPQPLGKSFRDDDFITGSRFQEAVELYIFDKKLRLLALDALERIEMAVRVDVAHTLGKHGSTAHHDSHNFNGNFVNKIRRTGKTGFQEWHEKYNQLEHRSRNEDFVSHNKKAYGKLPIWVAIEIFDFGCLSRLFAGMKHEDKQTIALKYGLSPTSFGSLLRSLSYIRNVSAHHSRLWNLNVVEEAKNPKLDSTWAGLNTNRPFFYFCAMQLILKVICSNSKWNERLLQHLKTFPTISAQTARIEDFGVNTELQSWDLWK